MALTIVAPPERTPTAGGLFSVVNFRGDEDRWQLGVTFPGQTCGDILATAGPGCEPGVDEPVIPYNRERPWGELPGTYTVSGTFSCSPVGVTLDEAEDAAVADLQRHEEAAVERVFWDTHLRVADPLTEPASPASPDVALGALEHHIAREYGTQGVIHAPRWLIPSLDVEMRGGRLVTKRLGTPVVGGAGYGFVGAETAIVATPALIAYRSPVEIVGDPEETFDRGQNLLQVLAQRTYLVGHDTCPPASIQVDPSL